MKAAAASWPASLEAAAATLSNPTKVWNLALKSADAEAAFLCVSEVLEAARRRGGLGARLQEDDNALALLTSLGATSRALARALRRQPRLLSWVLEITKRGLPLRHGPGWAERDLLRIAAQDLAGSVRLPQVVEALSARADGLIAEQTWATTLALQQHYGSLPGIPEGASAGASGLCVLALGKLGGYELNYASDVDLLCVYRADGETSGGEGGHCSAFQFATQFVEQLAAGLSPPGRPTVSLRVDLDLRPEGRSGPLANSLNALEQYYSTFGRSWERQAWIKARPIAGDLALGDEALRRLAPFVFPRSLDLAAIKRVGEMKHALYRQALARGSQGRDLKLGRGGIRTIEFIVQALQLLHGGKRPELRTRDTLGTLDALLFAGLLPEEEVRALSEAYVSLRRIEHRLQLFEMRQTHSLPSDPRRLEALARSLGFQPLPGVTASAAFQKNLEQQRDRVEALGDQHFGHEGESPTAATQAASAAELEAILLALQAASAGDPQAAINLERLCQRLGFQEPRTAAAHFRALAHRPLGPFGRAARASIARLGRVLLAELLQSPDKDATLAYLTRYLSALPGAVARGTLRTLGQEEALRKTLLVVFGSSHFLSRALLADPARMLPLLHQANAGPEPGIQKQLLAALQAELQGEPDEEKKLSLLRTHRNDHLLLTGLQDLSGQASLEAVSASLSALAERCLCGALDLAVEACVSRFGWPGSQGEGGRPAALAVVALGRLGAQEMSYGSDLDLLVLHSGKPEDKNSGGRRAAAGAMDAQEFFSRLTTRLISTLTLPMANGRLYAIDARLRPSGNQGALVSSLTAFERYHDHHSALWERQALCRGRVLLVRQGSAVPFQAALARTVYRPPEDTHSLAKAIYTMRARQVQNLSLEDGRQQNPKLGRGGIAAIEFLAQYFQLAFGNTHPELKETRVLPLLDAACSLGLLTGRDHRELQKQWNFLRRLENRLRIVHDRPIDLFPTHGPQLDALARRMGYHQSDKTSQPSAGLVLLSEYNQATNTVRSLFERLLLRSPS